MSETVNLSIEGAIAIVTLNRPEVLNALSQALCRRLAEVFTDIQARGDVRVAILTGAGRAFSAGVDLKELAGGEGVLQPADQERGAGHLRFGMTIFDGPVIAALNGVAVTGALELALCCDIRVASSAARFADTHARVGVIPGGRMSAMLPRLIGPGRAKHMALTGRMIDAATAERWGLVDHVVEPEELMPYCLDLARDIAAVDGRIMRTYNRLIDENYGMTFADAIDNEHIHSRSANQHFERGGLDITALTKSR